MKNAIKIQRDITEQQASKIDSWLMLNNIGDDHSIALINDSISDPFSIEMKEINDFTIWVHLTTESTATHDVSIEIKKRLTKSVYAPTFTSLPLVTFDEINSADGGRSVINDFELEPQGIFDTLEITAKAGDGSSVAINIDVYVIGG